MDFSQLSPELVQQLMKAFGANSPEELMQMAQQNPEAASSMMKGLYAGEQDADWINQSAQQQVEGQSIAPPRKPPSKPMTLFKQDRMPLSKDQSRFGARGEGPPMPLPQPGSPMPPLDMDPAYNEDYEAE